MESALVPLMIASTAMQAVGAIAQGNAEAAAANANADVADANAKIARQQGTERSNRVRMQARRLLAEQRAAMGEAGFISSTGSNLDLTRDTAAQLELDALSERYAAELDATGFSNSASLYRAEAKNSRRSGLTGSAGALLGGVNSYASYKTRPTAGGVG